VALNQQVNMRFSMERVMGLFVHKRIISAVKRVEFVSDRRSLITPRGRWRDIIVLNVYASTEDKIDDKKSSFF
jgi:hypothetical protein